MSVRIGLCLCFMFIIILNLLMYDSRIFFSKKAMSEWDYILKLKPAVMERLYYFTGLRPKWYVICDASTLYSPY